MKEKFYIVSKWRNKKNVEELVNQLRYRGYKVFNFFEKDNNIMKGEDPEKEMEKFENIENWQENLQIKEIFESDIRMLKNADTIILLLPAGTSSHIEAGIAYGLGKKLILIGKPEKPETHYFIFNEQYNTIEDFLKNY